MFEMLGLIGGFWFFIFVVIVLAAGIVSSEFDSFTGGAITFVGSLLVANYWFGIPVIAAIIASPVQLLIIFAVYVLVGGLYATYFKYPDFLEANVHHIKDRFNQFKKSKGPDYSEKQLKEMFFESDFYEKYRPYKNKERIASWVLMWPWGGLWDLTHKPVRSIYRFVHDSIGNGMDRVGKGKIDKNL